ncbi:MAG: TIM barrel protein [Planctomycetota bacterium]
MRLAWSTLACPDWTLDRVAAFTRGSGFDAAELRTFGTEHADLACEPFLTGAGKIREIFAEEGAEVAGLATSVRFDEPVFPPIIGRVFNDLERGIRACQRSIDLADHIGAEYVRVFGFETPKGDSTRQGIKRIGDRMRLAVDRADKRGTRVLVENGGDFSSGEALERLIDRADHRLVRACYHLAVGSQAGDRIADVVRRLGARLQVLRVTDDDHGRPAALGEGDNNAEATLKAALDAGFDGTIVYEYPALWFDGLADAEGVLLRAGERLNEWLTLRKAWKPAPVASLGV